MMMIESHSEIRRVNWPFTSSGVGVVFRGMVKLFRWSAAFSENSEMLIAETFSSRNSTWKYVAVDDSYRVTIMINSDIQLYRAFSTS